MSGPTEGAGDGVAVRHFESALRCTEEMLVAASAGDWQLAGELERERAFHLAAAGDAPSASMRDTIHRLVELNEAIRLAASAERDQLGERTRELRHATRAAQAYGGAAR